MAAKLTEALRNETAAHPGESVPVVDETGVARFYLVPEGKLAHLEAVAGEESEATIAKIRKLIAEADAAPDIEADEFRSRIRSMASERGLPTK